jgi:hypothetical protein
MYGPDAVVATSSLGKKQELFAWAMGKLLCYVYERGYRARLGDFHRPDKQGHMPGSLHYEKLAGDVNVFFEGKWLDSYDAGPLVWDDLGWYWKQLHPLCTWGGDFGDFNHFSVTNGGKK